MIAEASFGRSGARFSRARHFGRGIDPHWCRTGCRRRRFRRGTAHRYRVLLATDKEFASMDVRSIEDMTPTIEHNGTTPVWWLVRPQEMRDATEGGFLELVSEWEIAGGG